MKKNLGAPNWVRNWVFAKVASLPFLDIGHIFFYNCDKNTLYTQTLTIIMKIQMIKNIQIQLILDSKNCYQVWHTRVITRIHWLDRRIVRRQLDITPTCHYVKNQGKLMMQSRENGKKPQFGQFNDDFEVRYLQIANFSEKQVSFKFKVIYY